MKRITQLINQKPFYDASSLFVYADEKAIIGGAPPNYNTMGKGQARIKEWMDYLHSDSAMQPLAS